MHIRSITDMSAKNGTYVITVASGEIRGEISFTLSISEWKKLGTRIGHEPAAHDEVDERLYDILTEADERTRCLFSALRVLTRSDKSSRAIERALRAKNFSRDAIEYTVALIAKKGYLNENASCERYALNAVGTKHWGPRRIVDYLMSRGYKLESAKKAAEAIPAESYREALEYNIAHKCPDIASVPYAERQKKIAQLTRLGFSLGDIVAAIGEAEDES